MTIKNLEDFYEILKQEDNNLETKYPYTHEIKTKNKQKNISLGRIWFNLLLPDDYELITYQVDKKGLKNIIDDIVNKYDAKKAAETVNLFNTESLKLSTINPISFNADSFEVPKEILDKKEKIIKQNLAPDKFMKEIEKLGVEFLEYLKEQKSGIYDIIISGGRGKPIDWAVLTIARGPTINIEGQPTKIIENNVNDGFTLEEFYQNANESRAHFFTRSNNTEKPGVLARSIAFANADSVINTNDCGTKKYLEMDIKKNKSMRKTINGRYYLNENTNKLEMITEDTNLPDYIKLRSPLYCKDKDGLCSVCYGDLANKTNTKNVGMMASNALLDKGINLTMGARHQSSSSNLINVNFIEDLILIGK